jgi:hypothetical protein
MNWPKAVLAGTVGGAGMTLAAAVLRSVGLAKINGEMMLGSMLTGQMGGLGTWILGFGMHLVVSILIAFAYCGVMQAMKRRGAVVGLSLSPIHIGIAGFVMLAMPSLHPLIRSGDMPAPGAVAGNMGIGGVAFFVIEHLVYGALVGAAYRLKSAGLPKEEKAEVREREEVLLGR